jgi:L-threonine kinase
VLVIDPGRIVNTMAYNRVDRRAALASMADRHREAFDLLAEGVARGDPVSIGAAATQSARLHQRLLYNALLDPVLALAQEVGALGVCRAHSGSVLGMLLGPAQHDAADVAHYCQRHLENRGLGERCILSLRRLVPGGPTNC